MTGLVNGVGEIGSIWGKVNGLMGKRSGSRNPGFRREDTAGGRGVQWCSPQSSRENRVLRGQVHQGGTV